MKSADTLSLWVLGALWGASFLFMRMGADAFGPWALAGLRALGAGVCFLPVLASPRLRRDMRQHLWPMIVVGVTNSALPFVLFALAAHELPAGLSAMFDAITPLLVAGAGWLWLGERLSGPQVAGLALGLAGTFCLVGDSLGAGAGSAYLLACAACVAATVCYAFSVHYSRRRLAQSSPLAVAAGSQIVAAIVLTPVTVWRWPAETPHAQAWLAAAGLAVACTAVAYVLFFRLIARAGTARTMTVLYLIPAFGVLWGWLFLGETVALVTLVGCAIILVGTSLTTRQTSEGNRQAVPSELPG